MSIDPRWTCVPISGETLVFWDGEPVASIKNGILIIKFPIGGRTLNEDLLLIKASDDELQANMDQLEAHRGCFWVGARIVFKWLRNIELYSTVWSPNNHQLSVKWELDDGQSSIPHPILRTTELGFELRNQDNIRFHCTRVNLIIQLLDEFTENFFSPSMDECKKFLRQSFRVDEHILAVSHFGVCLPVRQKK